MRKKKILDLSGFNYEPITYELFVTVHNRIKRKLIEYNYENSPVFINLELIDGRIKRLLEQADRSCCGLIKSNGFYSQGKLILSFLNCLDNELTLYKNNKCLQKTINSFNVLTELLALMTENTIRVADTTNLDDEQALKVLDEELNKYPEFHRQLRILRKIRVTKQRSGVDNQIDKNSINSSISNGNISNGSISNGGLNHTIVENGFNSSVINKNLSNDIDDAKEFDSLPLFSPHLETICDTIYEAIAQPNTQNKDLIYRDHFMCWLDQGLISFFKLYTFVLPFLRVRLYKYPHVVFSSKFRAKILNRIISYPTVQFPFEFWNFSDLSVSLLFVKYKTRNTRTKSREIFIPSQRSIIIHPSYSERLKFNDVDNINFDTSHRIRCKYIKPKNVDLHDCDKIMVHYHGGGFFSQSCDSHEIYLRYWVNYNEIPILTVDYRVKEAFPVGLKDCFDVYLWLRKAPVQEVRFLLGYYPKKIVITGDSAGGNLGFGIALVLNDLRTDYKSKFNVEIAMPDGLVLIYSPFLINTFVSGSRVLSSLDTLVPLGVQLVILYGINGLIPGLRTNTALEALKTYLFPFNDPPPWFDCSRETFDERCSFLAKNINSPYLTSLFYDKFDQLKVPLHLISAEYCTFLDESITLAKLYKGPLKIDVLPNLCHGFLNLKFASKNVSNATMYCAHKVKEMFDQIDLSNTNE